MRMKNINTRPVRGSDLAALERWRKAYWEGDLEIPFGYERADGTVTTAVGTKDGKILNALTGKRAIVCDPLIVNPDADHVDVVAALYLLERNLTYEAQRYGAVESYIAVPNQLEKYHRIVENAGYVRMVENCTVFRRALADETVPLLGPERDELLRAMEGEEPTKEVELVEETTK